MNCCLTDKNWVQISLSELWLAALAANIVSANGVCRISFPKRISVLCLLDTPFVVSSSYNQLTLLASITRLDTLAECSLWGKRITAKSRLPRSDALHTAR